MNHHDKWNCAKVVSFVAINWRPIEESLSKEKKIFTKIHTKKYFHCFRELPEHISVPRYASRNFWISWRRCSSRRYRSRVKQPAAEQTSRRSSSVPAQVTLQTSVPIFSNALGNASTLLAKYRWHRANRILLSERRIPLITRAIDATGEKHPRFAIPRQQNSFSISLLPFFLFFFFPFS